MKYHKKKLLEGLKIGTEGGVVTTFGALNPTSDQAKHPADNAADRYD